VGGVGGIVWPGGDSGAAVEVTHRQARNRHRGEERCRPTNTSKSKVASRQAEVCGRGRASIVAGGGKDTGAAGHGEGEVVTRATRAEGECR